MKIETFLFALALAGSASLARAGDTPAPAPTPDQAFCFATDSTRRFEAGLALGAVAATLFGVVLAVEGRRPVPAGERRVAASPAWRVSLIPAGRGGALRVQF